jgi:hypothetical protein
MEPTVIATLASSVVALLVPYFKKAAEGFASSAGKAAWDAASQLHDFVRTALGFGPSGDANLQALQKAPGDPAIQEAVRLQLQAKMATDDKFGRELAALLKQADDAGVDNFFHTNIRGDVQKLVQIGVVHGNLTF